MSRQSAIAAPSIGFHAPFFGSTSEQRSTNEISVLVASALPTTSNNTCGAAVPAATRRPAQRTHALRGPMVAPRRGLRKLRPRRANRAENMVWLAFAGRGAERAQAQPDAHYQSHGGRPQRDELTKGEARAEQKARTSTVMSLFSPPKELRSLAFAELEEPSFLMSACVGPRGRTECCGGWQACLQLGSARP